MRNKSREIHRKTFLMTLSCNHLRNSRLCALLLPHECGIICMYAQMCVCRPKIKQTGKSYIAILLTIPYKYNDIDNYGKIASNLPFSPCSPIQLKVICEQSISTIYIL